jgi:hypothetical protein
MITSDELSIFDKDKVPRAAGNETTLRNHVPQDQARRLGYAVDSLLLNPDSKMRRVAKLYHIDYLHGESTVPVPSGALQPDTVRLV